MNQTFVGPASDGDVLVIETFLLRRLGKSLAYTGTEITLKETGACVCSGRHTKYSVPN
jgi:acyl-coenzyme A thioesterase PaaI-like protein